LSQPHPCAPPTPTTTQVITGSHDSTIKFWDLRKGCTMSTLTYHKKSVRALASHPTEFAFASAAADNIKKFKLPTVGVGVGGGRGGLADQGQES
jgi:WD40 repeat protein